MHPALPFTIAALLFGIGVYGVLVRRNAVLLLMAVELMLNAVNLIFVTADASIRAAVPRAGQSFALFVIVLAAAEIGVGLALILQLYRLRRTVGVDDLPLADAPPDAGGGPSAGSTGGPTGSDGPDGPDKPDDPDVPGGSVASDRSAESDEAGVAG
ncbi:NADH-quinone oxidoreductase subunit NuoK [Dactylosporangium sp. NPDC048998]|uniref:NADH-quinone oxidoreductase subunit NuoK n=1 Tax=Dactylosporangium sp. NPDC048998 TaxID=3363976 RepID=UPI003716ADFD